MHTLYFTHDMAALKQELQAGGIPLIHQFGEEAVVVEKVDGQPAITGASEEPSSDLSPETAMLVEAYQSGFVELEWAPAYGEGIPWDAEGMSAPEHPEEAEEPPPPGESAASGEIDETGDSVNESTGTPTSRYLIGSVAVGVVIVGRNTGREMISPAEQQIVISQVYKGLNWLATVEPRARITFAYDIQLLTVNTPPGPGAGTTDPYEKLEAPWRDAALAKMGYAPGRAGYRNYAVDLRAKMTTQWSYVAFFTKYQLNHFAYAIYEKVVMHYDNDGWGTANINRVFAHETCHIFGAADEYGNCSCGGFHGHLGAPNNNCVNCFPPGAQVDCLMNANTLAICAHSRLQLGWDPSLYPPTPSPASPLAGIP